MKLFKSCIKIVFRNLTFIPVMSKQNGRAFYAVAVGHNPGIYNTWSECKTQVDGVNNPKYKKFYNFAEAEEFINEHRQKNQFTKRYNYGNSSTSERCDSDCNNMTQMEHQRLQYTGDQRLRKKSSMNKITKRQLHRSFSAINGHKVNVNNRRRCSTGSDSYNMCQKSRNFRNSANNDNKFPNNLNEGRDPFLMNPPPRYFHMIFPDDSDETQIDVQFHRKMKYNRVAEDGGAVVKGESTTIRLSKPPKSSISNGDRENCLNRGIYQDSREGMKAETITIPSDNGDSASEIIIDENDVNEEGGTVKESFHHESGAIDGTEKCQGEEAVTAIAKGESTTTQQSQPPESRTPDGDRESCVNRPNFSKSGINRDSREGMKSAAITVTPSNADGSSEVVMDGNGGNEEGGTGKESTHHESGAIHRTEKCQGEEEMAVAEPVKREPVPSTSRAVAAPLSKSLVTAEDLGGDVGTYLKALVADINCKSSVTETLEKVVNVVAVTLKQITEGIVAVINDASSECSVADQSVRECRKSKLFSGEARESEVTDSGCERVRESTSSGCGLDLNFLRGRLDCCENKIDMCFGQISTLVAGLTEAKSELRELSQMIKNSNVKPVQSPVKQGGSWMSPGCSRGFATKTVMTDDSCSGLTRTQDRDVLEQMNIKAQDFDSDLFETPSKRKRMSPPSQIYYTPNTPPCASRVKSERPDYVGFTIDEDEYVIVYTDGACVSNGREDPKAGIGIWFGDGHPMNVSKPLKGVPTNNNAEIQAARIAIELALSAEIAKLKIYTDSEFLINCATKWMQRWKVKGWMTGANKPVKNREELEKLDKVMCQLSVRWEKVAAHCGIRGNEMADMLANKGATQYVRT